LTILHLGGGWNLAFRGRKLNQTQAVDGGCCRVAAEALPGDVLAQCIKRWVRLVTNVWVSAVNSAGPQAVRHESRVRGRVALPRMKALANPAEAPKHPADFQETPLARVSAAPTVGAGTMATETDEDATEAEVLVAPPMEEEVVVVLVHTSRLTFCTWAAGKALASTSAAEADRQAKVSIANLDILRGFRVAWVRWIVCLMVD
jgi:hypothetical protein